MTEKEITIDTEEIAEYLFESLIKKGLIPTEKELEIISDVFFDYLISKDIIEEE